MNTTNKNLTFKGSPLRVEGKELKIGDSLPSFRLTGNDLSDVSSDQFKGKVLVLSIVPSLDTPTCAIQTRRFNQEATDLSGEVVILTVSEDLPFAQSRWCGAEGVSRVQTASDYKYRQFGDAYGVTLPDTGLLTRAVVVSDKQGKIVHIEYVQELSAEPDYAAALKKVRELL